MSFKSKNLHYDSTQPAFLQRLRGQISSSDTDRHERPIARQKGQRQDDQDDAPAYVLEDTNQSLTKEEYEALLKDESGADGESFSDQVKGEGRSHDVEEKEAKRDNVTEVGQVTRKRKAVKVVGDDTEEANDKLSKVRDAKVTKKPKKKAKAIKLSFGDQEDG